MMTEFSSFFGGELSL